ncbi:135aa long hypothetical protein [Pyrococcus horikoshii OT3]|uniref:Uncharacterized protein n=1 Tax=Pyrococcus horikoshii (strain ATCC 700860 / DSM 12428 / JCM 9974 / NBRC 100139 / OT-3) TaxID=70601 RepID=O73973_PYRHO|nr:135aa long hypothetical protein [Pyrococcus horikoshii OT3]
MSYLLISSPLYLFIIAETLRTASFAISPSFPVTIILPSSLLAAGATIASIGKTIPLCSPIIAKPFTLPISPPSTLITWYSFFLSMYQSASCFSNGLANFNASRTSSLVTYFFPFLTAISPAALTTPPRSLSLSVR